MSSPKGALWLVKSSGRIMGPYADRQVFDLLRDRMILPLDEVSRPSQRWNYIRDVAIFAKVVEEIRVRNIRGISDSTVTGTSDEVTGVTHTITSTPTLSDDKTEEVNIGVKTVQDIMFHSIDDNVKSKSKKSTDSYTHENDIYVKTEATKSSRWVWLITAVVIAATSAFVVLQQFVVKPIRSKSDSNSMAQMGADALEQGDYSLALESFNKSNSLDPADASVYLDLGILKIQVENQAFQGRKLLEKIQNKDDRNYKRVLTGIGLALIKEGDLKGAEAKFNRALDIDPLYGAAVINLGAIAIYAEDWAKANGHLQLAIKDGSADGAEVLMLTESLIRLHQKENEKKFLTDGLKLLNDHLTKSKSYNIESMIGAAYIEMLLGEKAKIEQRINKILDYDLRETELHKQNLYVHRSKANWSLVSQWCLKLTQNLDPTARVIAFEAMCLIKAGDVVEANRKIEDAISQMPKDPLVQSTYAFILEEMNSNDRSSVAIQSAINNDTSGEFEQPKRLRALECASKNNFECEFKLWQEILEKNPQSLAALAGFAKIYLNKNMLVEAKKYSARGLRISSTYTPLIKISKEIEKLEEQKGRK